AGGRRGGLAARRFSRSAASSARGGGGELCDRQRRSCERLRLCRRLGRSGGEGIRPQHVLNCGPGPALRLNALSVTSGDISPAGEGARVAVSPKRKPRPWLAGVKDVGKETKPWLRMSYGRGFVLPSPVTVQFPAWAAIDASPSAAI